MSDSNKKSLPILPVLSFVVLASLAANAFLVSAYLQNRNNGGDVQGVSTQDTQAELEEILAKVAETHNLPQGVTPVLATVNNANSLKEKQPFFRDAEDGDKLLLYTNVTNPLDRKAYLFRPSTGKMINVDTINIGGQIVAQEDSFSIAIRNGTETPGLEDQMVALLEKIFPNATIVEATEASNTYTSSLIVAGSGSEEIISKVSTLFKVDTGELPSGEAAVGDDVDMLLILGGGGTESGQ